ncbi:MAG: leucine-rich repeat domain-containing protein [Muribaculaceae bacterium]|nr:leucine-rich repeat domain-containing protein [Muribaculaceae bacterium]
MKKILLTLFLLIMSLQLFAAKLEGIKIGDLKYDLDTKALTAEVTYGSVNYSNSNYVKGDVVIPSNVICYDETYDVIGIGQGAFSGCDKLESLTLPSSITYIKGSAFSGCSSLNKIEISDLKAWCNIDYDRATSNPLYYAKYLYLNGKEISDLILPNSIEEIKPMTFAYCKNLKSVTISDSVVTIGSEVFANCDSIRRVSIGSSVTSIGKDAFINCPIESLSLRCNKILNWFAGFDTLKNIEIGNSVTIIGSRAFYSCKGITSLYIPASITSIEEEAFGGCTNLTSIEISDLEAWCKIDYSTSSSNPLYYAKRLYLLDSEVSNLILPNSIKEIKPMTFAYCESIQSVTIPDSVTAIGSEVFADCKALTNVSIGRSITSIGKDAFKNCPIESLTLACPIISSWFRGFETIKTINLESNVLTLFKFRKFNLLISDCKI